MAVITTIPAAATVVLVHGAWADGSSWSNATFIKRLVQRSDDRNPVSGPEVAQAQIAAFRDWEHYSSERFADLKRIGQPTLVGVHDEMIPVANSCCLSANLPNAMLITYPDSGHGALFQFNKLFAHQVADFLSLDLMHAR